MSSKETAVLRQEVSSLLRKGAIEEVHPSQTESGFYNRYFVVPKKRWRLTANIGFTPFESCTQKKQIQDVDGKIYSVSDSTKRLVCHDRSEGCILSYSDHQETQEFPQIRFGGQSVSIPCSSFRVSPGSTNLHEMHGRSSGPVTALGRSCAKLPGRLADISTITDSSTLSSRSRAKSSKQPGLAHESPKECSDPLPTDNLFGDRSGFSRDEGTIVSPARSVIHVMPLPLQSRSYNDGEFVPQTFGFNGSSVPCNPSMLTLHVPISMVDKKPKDFSPLSSASYDFGDTEVCAHVKNLDVVQVSLRRSLIEGLFSPRDCHDGRVIDRLGGYLSRTPSPRNMDGGTARVAHKQIGAASSLSSSPTFFKTAERPSCVSRDGQHNSCVLFESPRRITLSPPMQAGEKCPSVDSGQVSVNPSGSRSGAPELQSGHALETEPGGRGMEAAPSNGELHMVSVWRSGSGLILIAVGSSVVAHSTVVCGTDRSVSGLSMGDSPQTGHAVASTGNDLAPTARLMETVGLASERNYLICPSLSVEAAETIINSRAVSTRRLYAFKWKLFTTWCRSRDMDPAYCPIASVLEFLQSRFSEGVTPATLKVYVAAISTNETYIDGVSVGRHPLVSRFMQGSRRLRPFLPARVPSWDLSIVLQGLSGHPFEHLKTAVGA